MSDKAAQREARRRRKINRLLKYARMDPYRAIVENRFWDLGFLKAFIEWCDAQAFEEPQKAIERSFLALELADRVADPHGLARAFALHGSAHRIQGKYAELKAIFAKSEAFALEAQCPCCQGEVLRRQSVCLQYRKKFTESLVLLDAALEKFSQSTDCDPHAIGKAEVNKGVSLKYLNRDNEALESQYRALSALSAEAPKRFHLAALTNIAFILSGSGEESVKQAETFIQNFRNELLGVEDFTIVRVKLSWIHGLICARLGERKKALQMLRKARKALVKLRQDDDAIAIAADISALYCETSKYGLISEIIQRSIVHPGKVAGDRIKAQLLKIQRAAYRESTETRSLILELRQEIAASVPCILVKDLPHTFASP